MLKSSQISLNLWLWILFGSLHCNEIGKDRVAQPWRLDPTQRAQLLREAAERLLCGFALKAIRRHFKPLSLYQKLPEAPWSSGDSFFMPMRSLTQLSECLSLMHQCMPDFQHPGLLSGLERGIFWPQKSMKDGGMSLKQHIATLKIDFF